MHQPHTVEKLDISTFCIFQASLWLRMAECCLGMYHTGALDKESNSKHDECPGGPVVANILAEKG